MAAKVLVIGASNSSKSINKRLATYASTFLKNSEVEILDLNDFEMPLFGVDLEEKIGSPEKAQLFKQKIRDCKGIIISFAENNGSYSVAFKNIIDWTSRIKSKLWEDKPMLFLSTAPGPRGGKSVMESALARFPHMGANIIGSLSVPVFNENFKDDKLVNPELNTQLIELVEGFEGEVL